MTPEIKNQVESTLQSEVEELGANFSENSGIRESGLQLTDGMDLTVPESTGPKPACMISEAEVMGVKTQTKAGYFTYMTHSGAMSKGSLFDGLKQFPWSKVASTSGITEFKDAEKILEKDKNKNLFLVPWKLLGKRCLATIPYETVTVKVKDSNAKEHSILLPYFAQEVKLAARLQPSLVPVFGYSSVTVNGVKCAVCELNNNYCVIVNA